MTNLNDTPLARITEDLLHRYECVILPGLGGFIVRDSPCNFNASKDAIKPFTRQIFFNPHLHQNDGLLTSGFQHTLGLSYNDAAEQSRLSIEELKSAILTDGSLSFGKLGTFFKGQENIWFAPDTTLNLCLDSYGLEPVPVSFLKEKETVSTETVAKKEETLADKHAIEEPEAAGGPGIRPWLIAASIALLVHFVYLTFEPDSGSGVQQASSVPSIHMPEAPEKPDAPVMEAIAEDTNPVAESLPEEAPAAPEESQPEPAPEESDPSSLSPEPYTLSPKPSTLTSDPSTPKQINQELNASGQSLSPEPSSLSPNPYPLIPNPSTLSPNPSTLVARYRIGFNADVHAADLRKEGRSATVVQNGIWYEVYEEEAINQK